MMFPHTVTIYNTETITEANFSQSTRVYPTVLHGVMVDAVKAVNVTKSGLESADAVTVYIPLSSAGGYVKPQEYVALIDKSGAWSLTTDGNGGRTYIVKGEYITDNVDLLLAHDDCYLVDKVDFKDYGGNMAHFEVGAK